MTQSTVFKNNRTQAVRIPKTVAFPEHVKKVKITQHGKSLLITPVESSWEEFFNGPRLDDDFIRLPQPDLPKRDW